MELHKMENVFKMSGNSPSIAMALSLVTTSSFNNKTIDIIYCRLSKITVFDNID
jgi:hypothetical protein